MKHTLRLLAALLAVVFSFGNPGNILAQTITTVAGTGTAGYSGDGGAATAAKLYAPEDVKFDATGNLYFSDRINYRIRKVTTSGVISTIAGNGTSGFSGDGGPATAAEFGAPAGIAIDGSGNIYVADNNNNNIRKINTSGIISTVAGNTTAGFSGDGGAATAAELNGPFAVALDASGNIYIGDVINYCVRKVNTSGIISTFAGTGGSGGYTGDGGAATAAKLYGAHGLAFDGSGNLYIADNGNQRIRKVTTAGIISTIAGNGTGGFSGDGGAATAAELNDPVDVAIDGSGNIYVSDAYNYRVRKITSSGVISTVAGDGTSGYSGDGGSPTAAEITNQGITIDGSGNLYIADYSNNRIRKISAPTTCSGTPSAGTAAASNNAVCSTGMPFTVYLSGASSGTGITYQWQSSSSGTGGWSNITGATNYNYSENETATTYFQCIVTCTSSSSSATSNVTEVLHVPSCYCTPAFTDAYYSCVYYYIGISLFHINGASGTSIYDTSNCDGSGYKDLTGLNVSLAQGSHYLASIATDASSGYYVNTQVWIDFNNDGYFDSTETVGGLNVYSGDDTMTLSIPSGAAMGIHRMRVVSVGETTTFTYPHLDPCTSGYVYGESRDYMVNIVSAACSGTPSGGSATSASTTICSSLSFTLSLTGASTGSGLMYQWQSSTDSTTWTNISGATNATYTGSESASTYYRCKISCGSLSSYSADILIVLTSSCYCTPSYTTSDLTVACSSYHMDIAGFHLRGAYSTGINDNTACDGTGYEVHTSMSVDLMPGSTYSPTIFTGPTYEMHAQVFIDFNNDGTFESTESVGGINNYVDSGTFTITIPSSVTSGATRMRVVTVYSSPTYPSISSCPSGYTYGETRDYSVYIGTPPPAVTVAPTSLSFGSVAACTTSSIQSFTITGTYLTPTTGTLTVNAPTNFLISSTSGGTYASSYLVTYSDSAYSGTCYVEFVAPCSTGTYSGCINITGGGLTSSVCESVSGTSSSAPTVTVSADSLVFGIDTVCRTSAAQSLTLSFTSLTPASGSITISAPTDFLICSTSGGSYVSSYTISYTGGTISAATVYVKFVAPCTAGTYTGCLYVSGGGVSASFCLPLIGRCAVACSGTPSAGTASISPLVGGTTTSFTLSLTGYTVAYGITFQWASATSSGGTYTNIYGATNPVYSFTGISTGMCYECKVNCSYSSGGSTSNTTCVTFGSPSPIITTFAGNGTGGNTGDGGPATAAEIDYLNGVVADASGNVYFTMGSMYVVRKVNPSGIISTFAGSGSGGYSGDGGAATAAALNLPIALAVDGSGNVYIADENNNRIRKVTPSGTISTYAGNGSAGFSGDGGPATAAKLNSPIGIAFDGSGNLYIAEYGNARIRKVNTSGVISTFAGTGTSGYSGDGGAATAANIGGLDAVATDRSGNVYFIDESTHRARKINTSGIISTITGNGTAGYSGDDGFATAAELNRPNGITTDATGNVYICDQYNNRIREINTYGVITTYAGNGTMAFAGDGGPATASEMSLPTGVTVAPSGSMFISDFTDYRVRRIGSGNHVPYFTGGSSLSLNVCENASATSINSIMAIADADTGQTETWSVNATPAHGTLAGFTATATSTGGTLTPTGLAYTPNTSYSGADSFKIQIYDGLQSSIATVYVTVYPTPTAGAISGPSTVCIGSTITLSDSGSSGGGGTWSSSNTSVASVNSSGVVRGISGGTTTISYLVYNSCGSSTATKTITVSPAVSAGTISGSSSVCTGTTTILTDSVSGGAWSSSNSSIASVNSGGIVRGVSNGTVTISYSVTTSCGTATATKTMSVISVPSVPAISGPSSVCVGSTITLTDSTGGGAWISHTTSVATIGSTSGVLTGVSAGSTFLTYTVTNSCGSASANATITVNAAPSTAGSISGPTSVCTGASITLSDGTSGGTWSSASSSIASVNSAGLVTGVTAGTTTISYTISNSCGSVAATSTVAVTASPTAGTISGPTTICAGSANTLTDGASSGTWSSSNTAVATINTAGVFGGVMAGSAIISYTVTNICGTARATVTITVNPLPVAGTVSGTSAVCPGATITLTDGTTGGSWSSSNTAAATVNSSGVVTGVAAGTTNISYTVANSCGAVAATKTVSVGSVASAGTIAGPTSMCIGSHVTLTDTTSGGAWSSANPSIATVSPTGVVTGYSVGTTAISYTISTSCGSATTASVVSVGSLPSAGTITGPTSVCTGTTISLTDATTGGSWVSSNTAIATVNSTGVITGVSAGSVTISYYVSSSCATAITTANVTVSTSVSAGTITGLATVCQGSTITLTDGTSGGTWSSSNTARATVSIAGVVSGVAAGAVTISYSLSGGCGTAVVTKSITVNPLATVAAISGATAVCSGSTTTFTDATSGGAWLSSNTSIASVNASGVVRGVATGTATITYFVTGSCGTAVATKVITVSTLSAGAISGSATVVAGSLITLTESVSGGAWSSGSTGIATVSASGAVTGVSAGTDTIVYSVTNVCGTATASKVITVTAHREQMPAGNGSEIMTEMRVYPNPNNGSFTVEIPGGTGIATILITDLTGRVIEKQQSEEKTLTFDLGKYADGVYLLQVSIDGAVYSQKLIKN